MLRNLFLPKALFVLLIIVSLLFNSFEGVIALSLLLLFLLFSTSKTLISGQFLTIISSLILILLIAVFGAFFRDFEWIDFIKDFLYLLKPILFLLIGYFICKKINDRNSFFKIIIYVATGCAAYHIIRFLIYISEPGTFSMNHMRPIVGLDNFLELFAIAIIIANKKHKWLEVKHMKLFTIILSISFVLYFSRTMFALVIVMSLAFMGYLRISKKGLKYILIGLVGLIAFYTYLFSINIPRDSKSPVDNFLYKMKSAPSEIFIAKKSFDIRDHASLWDHWRAYEVNKAIGHLNEGGASAWSFGLGAGSLVDLDFYAPLSDNPKGMRYISILHNGYAFVIYKTGIFGILCYLIFLLANYLAYKKSKFTNPLMANMIFGIVLFYLSTSLVITGIYNLADTTTLILGGILFLNHKDS